MLKLALAPLFLVAAVLCAPTGSPLFVETAAQDHVVLRGDQKIHVWERRPKDAPAGAACKVAVFLHGGTWSGRPDFDLQVEGYSAMARFAAKGWTTYCVDVQGYGQSDNPVGDNWSGYEEATLDVLAAIDFIRKARGVEDVSLIGWSWGSLIAGHFAAEHPERVASLVLYGTRYAAIENAPEAPTEKYRVNDAEGARSDFVEGCHDPKVADAFVKAALAADPDTPNGVYRDYFVNLPILAPERLSVPTLVIVGEHEAQKTMDDLLDLFTRIASPDKRLVVVPGGGHAVHLENGRDRWYGAVLEFLGR